MVGEWLVFLVAVMIVRGDMEGYIVGGTLTSIQRYPHSAFLSVNCVTRQNDTTSWICGSSIVNQRLLLTAAHCVYTCFNGTTIVIHFGNEYRDKGSIRSANGFIIHEMYNMKTNANDIALVRVAMPLKLQEKISRVALMKNPPYKEVAKVAGWGLTDETNMIQGYRIKAIEQKIWSRSKCLKRFGAVPKGTICASDRIKTNFAAQGDSGSALVVRGYIQVGVVSYKVPSVADYIIIYTDVGHFYDWIVDNARRLYCAVNKFVI